MLKPNSWTKSRQKSYEFSSLLFTVTPTALLEIFLLLQTHATSYSFCKGERRKTWKKTIRPFLWFKKFIQKPQVWELSRLCPETSTWLYVHEFTCRADLFFTFFYNLRCRFKLQTVQCCCGTMKSCVWCTGFRSEDDALRKQEEQPEGQPEPSLPSHQPG